MLTLTHISLSLWIYGTLLVAYCFTVLSIVIVVVGENRSPVRSLAWITVLMLLPVVGVVIYAFFGRSLKNVRLMSRRERKRLKHIAEAHETSLVGTLSADAASMARLGLRAAKAPCYSAGEVTFFTDGTEKFNALKADLEAAEEYIYLQYYIFLDDTIGSEVSEILCRKARSGVNVKVIYDRVGCWSSSKAFFTKMKEASVEVVPFAPVAFPRLGTQINWRNHRKIVVIDGKVGYVGGMNIADRYIHGGNFPCWRDVHARICSDAVKALQLSFALDWNCTGRTAIPTDTLAPDTLPHDSHEAMQLVTSGPVGEWSNVMMMYLHAIGHASRRIFIQTPYFLPSESLIDALCTAALAHIDVRIMIPAKSDSRLLDLASQSYVKQLLLAGAKVYFYRKGMLHSKLMVVDDNISTIGSTNFDFRSFEHNFECNAFFYGVEHNSQLAEIFLHDQANCTAVEPQRWLARRRWRRALESLARLLSPVL